MAEQTSMPIAVVAMACRLPGDANNPKQFWDNLIEKRDAWVEVPKERFNIESFYNPVVEPVTGGSLNFKGAYFLKGDLGRFDTTFFNVTKDEAAAIDPQQRLQLECIYEAFEAASIPMHKIRGSNTAVYTAGFSHDYEIMQFRDPDNMSYYHANGVQITAASRISYFYDLRGQSIAMDTACSGTGTALHLACQALKSGEADQAIVSGASLLLDPDPVMGMNKLQMFSPHGRSYAFDHRAHGYGRGEGAGCLIVKPLSAAIANGDPIRAVIRGTATNQNGRASTITITSVRAQIDVGLTAYQSCNLSPHDTYYVEAHGTGTSAGDPLEMEAIGRMFGNAKRETLFGSVKTNIGHLEPVSGLGSLFKSILILENGVIPAHLNYEKPNPKAKLDDWNLRIPTEAEKWKDGVPRRISINNFGVGGSNTHIILESFETFCDSTGQQVPASVRKELTRSESSITKAKDKNRLFLLSAQTELSCKNQVQALKGYCEALSDEQLDSLAYTLSKKWEGFSWRWSITASSRQELLAKIDQPHSIPTLTPKTPKVGLIFAGQGAQWFAMGRELLESYSIYRDTMVAADRVYRDLGAEWSLIEELSRDTDTSRVDDAAIGQPLSTALQVALVELLRSWNVQGDTAIGHSSGEIAAAYAAGALSLENALTIAYFRGLHTSRMQRLDGAPDGTMMAAGLSVTDADAEIARLPADLSTKLVVACVNSPSSVTISGNRQAVLALQDVLNKRDTFARLLKVDVAYHSKDMQLIADSYRESITHCVPTEGNGAEFWSSVRTTPLRASELQPEYWIENLVSQVRFSQGLENMCQQTGGLGLLIEVSPHSVLQAPIKQILGAQHASIQYTSILKRNSNALTTALQAVQKMLESGVVVDVQSTTYPLLDPETTTLLTDLPSYAFDRSVRHWKQSALTTRHLRRSFPYHELLGSRVLQSTTLEPQWRNTIKLQSLSWMSDHRVNDNVIFPGTGYLCIAMQAFYQYYVEKGYRTAQPKALELRDIVFERALLLDEPLLEVEMVCSIRPVYENTRETAESRFEFRVVSCSDTSTWQKHCHGTIVALPHGIDASEGPEMLINGVEDTPSLDRKESYQITAQMGMQYGPTFRTVVDGKIYPHGFEGHVQQARLENAHPYIVHPATLDGILQAMFVAEVHNGNVTGAMVPVAISRLVIACDTGNDDAEKLLVRSSSRFLGKTNMYASASVSKAGSDQGLSVIIENLATFKLEEEVDPAMEDLVDHGCYRTEWFYDPTLLDFQTIQQMCADECGMGFPVVNRTYVRAARHFYREALAKVPNIDDVKADHLRLLWNHMKSALDSDSGPKTEEFHLSEITKDDPEAEMLKRFGAALPDILRGEVDPLSLMLKDDLLYNYYCGDWVDAYYEQLSFYINMVVRKTPTMKILEIGAGSGATTLALLKNFPVRQGFTYDFTDISAGFFIKAKELLSEWTASVNYKKLDIETDPIEQGFKEAEYDLIIASNVLHATRHMETTLKNTRKLLKPGGQLVLLEVTKPTLYLNLVFGCLSGWWLGKEDDRTDGPCLSGAAWVKKLTDTGFTSPVNWPDDEEGDSWMSVILASAEKTSSPGSFAIIPDTDSNLIDPLQLQKIIKDTLSSPCEIIEWKDAVSPDQICIFTGSSTPSLLISGNKERFELFQKMVSTAFGAVVLTSEATGDKGLPESAVLTGLHRGLRAETETMRFITVDLESPSDVAQVSSILRQCFLETDSFETEFAIREGEILIPRVMPEAEITEFLKTGSIERTQTPENSFAAIKLDFRTQGLLDSLRFIPDDLPQGDLDPDQIQISIKAAGINFRHVLYALGKFSAAEYAARPAGECSGVVTAVGRNAKDQFQVGDRVLASGIFNAFTTAVRVPASIAKRIPDSMDFITAAQFPLTYITSWFSLVNVAHIKSGDNVLIHSGSGAVGQAAITMAQHFNANVFATCGNDEKKAFLVAEYGIPEDHIYSSKDFRFVDGILKATKGKGVDIILNSLSGEFITESCRCLATFGRFIEIGKNDILMRSKIDMGIFNNSTSFIAVDLSRVYELAMDTVGEMVQKMIDLIADGSLKRASPVHVRPFGEAADAFRYMSTGKHIGKMVLDMSDVADLKVTIPDYGETSIRSTGTYILSGGLGGLGRAICLWMAKRAPGVNLVVLSRGSNSAEKLNMVQDLTAKLQKEGATLHIVTCDVSDEGQVKKAIEWCKASLPPIRGIIQAAMVLRDALFEKMTAEQFQQVILPKVHGTQYLVKYCPPSGLDFFVMLSSVVGVIGGPGQVNYSAASVFQDSYARYLTSIGEPTTCLDLGWIKGAGYVEEHKNSSIYIASKGMQPISLDTFFRALSYAFTRKPENAKQSQITLGLSATMQGSFMRVGRLQHLLVRRSQLSQGASATTASAASIQKALLECKTYQEAKTYVSNKLFEKIASLMAIPLSNLKPDDSLADCGIDSLVGIELRNFVRQDLGCSIGTFEILGVNSIRDLGELATQKCRWLQDADFKDAPAEKMVVVQKDENGNPVDGQSSSDTPSELSGDTGLILSSSQSSVSTHNDKLPSLPVPSLDITTLALDRSLRLILSEKEYLRSRKQIEQFVAADGPGRKLQSRLVQHAKTKRNWHTELWMDKQYFESRAPIAPFTNYFGVQKSGDSVPVSMMAAGICAALLEFQEEVESDTLERDLLRDAAAEMEQYKNAFNACRIPQKLKDCIVRFDAASHRHIVVIRDGHFFKLNYEYKGRRLGVAQLIDVMDSILEMDVGSPSEIGAFTSMDRDTWAEARTRLKDSSPEAKQSIEDVESACFVICLDSAQPKTIEESLKQVWFGNGINRWFDKPIQFIINGNGTAGFVGEHSACDGTPAMRIEEHIYRFGEKVIKDLAGITNGHEDYGQPVTVLKFPTTSELSKLAVTARTEFERTISTEDIVALTCDEWGRDALSSKKINPNYCVELILILAAYRMYGELKPCYEPVSLRSFASGRWATCSMVIEEVLKFCQLADDNKATHTMRETALYAALRAHGRNISRTADGLENTEAHLLALKEMVRDNEEIPELFQDPVNQKSQRWVLSAAFLQQEHDNHYWGFWQVVEEGFAIGDIIRSDRLEFVIMATNGDCKRFSSHIQQATRDVGRIIGVIP